MALGSLRVDPANLVIACRRIVGRQPDVGPMWWLCAHLLTSNDPSQRAWELVDEIDGDAAERQIAAALPDEATVLTIGWPEIGGAALMALWWITRRRNELDLARAAAAAAAHERDRAEAGKESDHATD